MITYNGVFAAEINKSMEVLLQYYPELSALEMELHDSSNGLLEVKKSNSVWQISAGNHSAFLRGIGHALSGCEVQEKSSFEKLGIMLDCSRNKVHKVSFIKDYFCKISLMGYNFAMLYTEDTYTLEDEPLFGYMRGAYTLEEIKELDDIAFALSIEMTACIQTLGHLGQILQYSAYTPCRDTAQVMRTDTPETFALIEKMICFWEKALRSRRIHIGMDETRDLGRGRYLDINRKYVDGYTLFSGHLNKMNQLCGKYGLQPIIWSDMFFRLGNAAWVYYDPETVVPPEVKAAIPENVRLCYWDYYHDDASFYENYMLKHRELGSEPLFGSGVWTWSRIWYDHPLTVNTALPGIAAGIKTGLKELFFTMWGDNGAYCLFESALAGLEMCAGAAYGSAADDVKLYSARSKAVGRFDYSLYTETADIYSGQCDTIMPEYIYWDDPLMGLYTSACYNRQPENFNAVIEKISKNIRLIENSGTADDALLTLHDMFCCIKGKVELYNALNKAYSTGDKAALQNISGSMTGELIAACSRYDRRYRDNWLKNAKPFGLEVIQRRSAGMINRLHELQLRINEYLDGKISSIDELDARLTGKVTEGLEYTASFIR